LFVASANGDLATVQQIIRDTPELLNSFVWYESPLHYAVRENQIDVARELLAAGINPGYSNFTYSSWQSLLPIAKDRGFDQLHALLVGEMQQRF
jgi:ankyrin repeat protein